MSRAEIIEGLKDIYGTLYAYIHFRKIIDLKIIEACLELLENENALIDRVLEIIDSICDDFCTEELNCILLVTRVSEIREAVETMKGGEQE